MFVFLQELGYTRMILKSGGELSITALVTAVQKEWAGDSKNFQTHVPVQFVITGQTEPLRQWYTALKVSRERVKLPWINLLKCRSRQTLRSCRGWCDIRVFSETGLLYDRAAEHHDKFQSPLLNVGEAVLAKESGAQERKLGSSRDLGLWMGRSTRTNEHLVGTRTGVIRARTVKRRPETLKWERAEFSVLVDRWSGCKTGSWLDTNTWMQSE